MSHGDDGDDLAPQRTDDGMRDPRSTMIRVASALWGA